MTKEQVHIRCTQCGTFNVNEDYCVSCGHSLNMIQQREEERKELAQKRIEKALEIQPSKVELFLVKMTNHPWLVIRVFFKLIYGIWFVVMAIAMFLAWLISLIIA